MQRGKSKNVPDGLKKEPAHGTARVVGQSGVRSSRTNAPNSARQECPELHHWHESHPKVHRKQGAHVLSVCVLVDRNTSPALAASLLRPNRNPRIHDGPHQSRGSQTAVPGSARCAHTSSRRPCGPAPTVGDTDACSDTSRWPEPSRVLVQNGVEQTDESGIVPDAQQVSQTQPMPNRVKAAPSDSRQTLPAGETTTAARFWWNSVLKRSPHKNETLDTRSSNAAPRKGRHATTMTSDVFARQAFRVEALPRCLLYNSMAWNQRDAHKRWTRRSETLRQEPTFTTSQTRDLHREQSLSEEAASGPSFPKLTSESHRTRELQPNPRDLWPWVGKVNHTSPPNRKTKRLPLTKKKKQAAARTVGSLTTTYTTGAGALQQWRAIQSSHRLELQRLQHRIGIVVQDTTSAGLAAPATAPRRTHSAFSPASASLSKTWIFFGRSCSGEAALDFQSMDDGYDFHRPLASSLTRYSHHSETSGQYRFVIRSAQ